jgi:uncharacterized protein (DUF488 family)
MRLYTVGHSNHTQDEFLRLLNTHFVNCVVDVRSVPASSHNPQFNQEPLGWFLREKNIDYQFFGRELGARRMDCINQDGLVDFERAIHTAFFQEGVDKLMGLLDTKIVTLMCSEAEPLECHRFALVARYFYEHRVGVFHILKDASVVSHHSLEQKRVDTYLHAKRPMLAQVDELFGTYNTEQQLQDAYRLKNKEIGFRLKTDEFID